MLLNVESLYPVKSYTHEQRRGNIYSAFKSRRIILLEQGMTREQGRGGGAVAGAFFGAWGIHMCE